MEGRQAFPLTMRDITRIRAGLRIGDAVRVKERFQDEENGRRKGWHHYTFTVTGIYKHFFRAARVNEIGVVIENTFYYPQLLEEEIEV